MLWRIEDHRKTHGRNGRVAAGLLFLTVAATVALAQLPTATILGTVKDSTGAVVPGATLTVRNTETGFTRTGPSGADGSYRFAALPVGSYEVRVEQTGFQTGIRGGLTLTVGQEAVVNFALEVGAIAQTVTVTEEAPLVNTTSGSIGGLVGAEQVADLPLNGRNYVDLTLLQPGVVHHRPATQSLTGAGTWFSANGAPPRSNFYLLDGAPMGNAQGASSSSVGSTTLGVEGIREWRVVTNSFSAEYGMRMGGQMTIVSKGGTNSFHGSLFEYLRNSVLDARNFFDYKTEAFKGRLPGFRRNQFGGSVGGPIKKDKLLYFVTFEALKERLGKTTISNVMAPSAKVDGGVVPQINPLIKPLLALYPDPNLPGNRFTFPSALTNDEYYGQARGDYNISSNDSFFVRVTEDSAARVEPLDYPQFTRVGENRMHFVTGSETHIFSPSLVGTFRLSYSRVFILVDSPSGLSGPQYSLLPNKELGQLQVGGITTLGPDAQTPNSNLVNLFTWSGDLYYTKGRHSLKFGSLTNHYRPLGVGGGTGDRGSVVFADLNAFLIARATSYSGKTPGTSTKREYQYSTWGLYLQDDFRALRNLTLNLGMRYEFHTDFTEVTGRGSALRDIRRDAEFAAGLVFLNPSLKDFSPRFGFAWDIQGDGRTSVRGGFGLIYDIGAFGAHLSAVSNAQSPFSSMSTVSVPSTLTALPLVFPREAVGRSVRTMDYHIRNPHMLHYNFTMERQLPWDLGLSLAYAGSRGFNLMRAVTAANPPIHQLRDGRFFWLGNEPRPNPYWDTLQQMEASRNSWYNSLQFVARKRLSRGLQFQSSYTWAKLIDEKAGVAQNENGGSAGIGTNLLPRELDRGLSDYTVAHAWAFNAIYRLPERSAGGGLPGKLFNGWWMSGILTAQTGLPFTTTTTGDRSRSRGAGNLPDLRLGRKNDDIIHGASAGCAGVPAGQKLGGPEKYFDPCAFSLPTLGTLGNEGRNILTAPGVANLDFSLVKDTALGFLGESGNLEFRAEFFNILNRVNFARPTVAVFSASSETALATAGVITGTDTTSRQIQFALKVIW